MYTCCPRGYQCDLTGNYCYRFNQASDSNPFSDALSMMKSYEEIKAEKLQKVILVIITNMLENKCKTVTHTL